MSLGGWFWARIRGKVRGNSTPLRGFMTESKPPSRARIAPAGLMFLAITSVGWGFNWPVTKYLLSELPPLTMRGSTGVVGAALLAGGAVFRRQNLRGPRRKVPPLVVAACSHAAPGAYPVRVRLPVLAPPHGRP